MTATPESYKRDAKILETAIRRWLTNNPTVKLEWKAIPVDTFILANLNDLKALSHLCGNQAAIDMLLAIDKETGERASFMMAVLILEKLGLIPRDH